MRVTVDSMIRLREPPPDVREGLWRRLTFPNPEYEKRLRYGRYVGDTPPNVTLLERDSDGTLVVPRGAVGSVRQLLAAAGETAEFDDRRVLQAPVELDLAFELRDYQKRAVDSLAAHTQGCAVLPCGSGKTVIGAGLIARLKQPAIVLVHTKELLQQWKERLRDALGVDAGTVGDGVVDPRVVTVAMVQTLTSMPRSELEALGERFGTVIQDEAHHVPAQGFRLILGAMPGKYRFGLTATPERPDGLTPLLGLCIGATAFSMSHDELIDAGYLVRPKIRAVPSSSVPLGRTYNELVSGLIVDRFRNRTIVDIAAQEARGGHSVLVLSARVDHCHALAELLVERNVIAAALTSSVPRRRRREILDGFRDGSVEVVCATSLADEGLDVPNLSRLILATPARAQGRTIQRLGRLMRPHPDKSTPVLIDIVDDHPLARKQYFARQKAYQKVLGCHASSTSRPRSEGSHGLSCSV